MFYRSWIFDCWKLRINCSVEENLPYVFTHRTTIYRSTSMKIQCSDFCTAPGWLGWALPIPCPIQSTKNSRPPLLKSMIYDLQYCPQRTRHMFIKRPEHWPVPMSHFSRIFRERHFRRCSSRLTTWYTYSRLDWNLINNAYIRTRTTHMYYGKSGPLQDYRT